MDKEYAEVWCQRCERPATGPDAFCNRCRARNGWLAAEWDRTNRARARRAARIAANRAYADALAARS